MQPGLRCLAPVGVGSGVHRGWEERAVRCWLAASRYLYPGHPSMFKKQRGFFPDGTAVKSSSPFSGRSLLWGLFLFGSSERAEEQRCTTMRRAQERAVLTFTSP